MISERSLYAIYDADGSLAGELSYLIDKLLGRADLRYVMSRTAGVRRGNALGDSDKVPRRSSLGCTEMRCLITCCLTSADNFPVLQ